MPSKESIRQYYERKNPLREFVVAARPKPTEARPNPPIYKMKIFANDAVVAKSRFWYFMKKLKKLKKINGELLHVSEITQHSVERAKNFAIWVRYRSRSGTHNMYKEYRATSTVDAVNQMYQEMASRHKARFFSVQIVDVAEIASNDDVKRANTIQYLDDDVKFPVRRYRVRQDQKDRKVFAIRAPTLFGY